VKETRFYSIPLRPFLLRYIFVVFTVKHEINKIKLEIFKNRNISVVSRPDRRELLAYLDGEMDTTPSIDKNAPLEIAMQRPLPYTKSSTLTASTTATNATVSVSGGIQRPPQYITDLDEQMDVDHRHLTSDNQTNNNKSVLDQASEKEKLIGRITKKFDETAAQSQRPITENITQLSDKLTMEKIAAIKAKKKAQQRKQVAAGVDIDDELMMHAVSASTVVHAQLSSEQSALNDAIMKEIQKRECVAKNRFSVLQSNGKQFEKDINAFLQLIKAKEEGGVLDSTQDLKPAANSTITATTTTTTARMGYNRFDQERYAGKDETGGFSIDTKLTYQPNVGPLSMTPNPNATPAYDSSSSKTTTTTTTQLTQQKTNIVKPQTPVQNSQQQTQQSQKKGHHQRPIIIIPNTNTSLITMYNASDILQDLK
jgi:parafibromin